MLTTMPDSDTLEGRERAQMVEMAAALRRFIRATEEARNLTPVIQYREKRHFSK